MRPAFLASPRESSLANAFLSPPKMFNAVEVTGVVGLEGTNALDVRAVIRNIRVAKGKKLLIDLVKQLLLDLVSAMMNCYRLSCAEGWLGLRPGSCFIL